MVLDITITEKIVRDMDIEYMFSCCAETPVDTSSGSTLLRLVCPNTSDKHGI